jgi:hypothetical protein
MSPTPQGIGAFAQTLKGFVSSRDGNKSQGNTPPSQQPMQAPNQNQP